MIQHILMVQVSIMATACQFVPLAESRSFCSGCCDWMKAHTSCMNKVRVDHRPVDQSQAFSEIARAVETDDFARLVQLIMGGASVSDVDSDGKGLLFYASSRDMAALLYRVGSSPQPSAGQKAADLLFRQAFNPPVLDYLLGNNYDLYAEAAHDPKSTGPLWEGMSLLEFCVAMINRNYWHRDTSQFLDSFIVLLERGFNLDHVSSFERQQQVHRPTPTLQQTDPALAALAKRHAAGAIQRTNSPANKGQSLENPLWSALLGRS